METETSQNKSPVSNLSGIEKLLKLAADGDEATVPFVRQLLDILPDGGRAFGGDLVYQAEQSLVRSLVGKNIALREALDRQLKELRRELGGPTPQPLERLLVERVVMCWLHAYHADFQFAETGNSTLENGSYLQKQQDRAQRRYLAAIKCLATVRRLALPIKVDLTLAGTVETQPRPACRRPVEADHAGAFGSACDSVRRKAVNSKERSRSRQ